MNLVKKTSLQNVEANVKETLDWKLIQIKEKNLPVESSLADYIAFGMEGIENDIEQLSNYKTLIETQIKQAKENQSKVKIECAEWLANQGLDKLNGLNVSSITITKAVEEKTTITQEDVWVDVDSKIVLDKNNFPFEKAYELLEANGYIEKDSTDVIKFTSAKPSQIKVNQKRK